MSTYINTYTREGPDPSALGNVLVVDDDPAVLMMLVEVLRERGFYVAGAATSVQAQELMLDFIPQAAVIGTDGRGTFDQGWRLAARLRRQMPRLPLIMVSTSDAAVAEVGVTERGRLFDAALLKPFRIRELVAHLQVHCGPSSSTTPIPALPASRIR
jgi:two-component system nitrogen regulation response regulator GlnG